MSIFIRSGSSRSVSKSTFPDARTVRTFPNPRSVNTLRRSAIVMVIPPTLIPRRNAVYRVMG